MGHGGVGGGLGSEAEGGQVHQESGDWWAGNRTSGSETEGRVIRGRRVGVRAEHAGLNRSGDQLDGDQVWPIGGRGQGEEAWPRRPVTGCKNSCDSFFLLNEIFLLHEK